MGAARAGPAEGAAAVACPAPVERTAEQRPLDKAKAATSRRRASWRKRAILRRCKPRWATPHGTVTPELLWEQRMLRSRQCPPHHLQLVSARPNAERFPWAWRFRSHRSLYGRDVLSLTVSFPCTKAPRVVYGIQIITTNKTLDPRLEPRLVDVAQSNLLDLRSGSNSGAPAARAPHRALTRDSSNTFIYGRPARARAVPRRAPTTARHMICLLPFPSMQQHIVLIARCSTLPSVTKAHVPIKRTPHRPWSLASWYSLDPCPRPPDRPAASTGRLPSCLSCACAHTDSGRCAPWRRTCGSRRGGWSHRPRPA